MLASKFSRNLKKDLLESQGPFISRLINWKQVKEIWSDGTPLTSEIRSFRCRLCTSRGHKRIKRFSSSQYGILEQSNLRKVNSYNFHTKSLTWGIRRNKTGNSFIDDGFSALAATRINWTFPFIYIKHLSVFAALSSLTYSFSIRVSVEILCHLQLCTPNRTTAYDRRSMWNHTKILSLPRKKRQRNKDSAEEKRIRK